MVALWNRLVLGNSLIFQSTISFWVSKKIRIKETSCLWVFENLQKPKNHLFKVFQNLSKNHPFSFLKNPWFFPGSSSIGLCGKQAPSWLVSHSEDSMDPSIHVVDANSIVFLSPSSSDTQLFSFVKAIDKRMMFTVFCSLHSKKS